VTVVNVQPYGGGSGIAGKLNLPVVHVGYRDAFAFCVWANKRLLTELEWEYIAQTGSNGPLHHSLSLSLSLSLAALHLLLVDSVSVQ